MQSYCELIHDHDKINNDMNIKTCQFKSTPRPHESCRPRASDTVSVDEPHASTSQLPCQCVAISEPRGRSFLQELLLKKNTCVELMEEMCDVLHWLKENVHHHYKFKVDYGGSRRHFNMDTQGNFRRQFKLKKSNNFHYSTAFECVAENNSGTKNLTRRWPALYLYYSHVNSF